MVFSFCNNNIFAISSFFVDESGNKDILMMHNMTPNISAPLGFTIPGIERVNKNSRLKDWLHGSPALHLKRKQEILTGNNQYPDKIAAQ